MGDLGLLGTVPGPDRPVQFMPPDHPPTTKRWARVTYGAGLEGRGSLGSGLAGSFLTTAHATSPRHAVYGALCWMLSTYPARRVRSARHSFRLGGREIPYLSKTIATERRAEVPVGLDFLRSALPTHLVLEVGNVLGPYGAPRREVIDLYERGPGIVNEDIVKFAPGHRYDRIVSISTLEHVGFDEPVQESGKFRAALDHLLHDLLTPGGWFLATVPLGYNPEVDRFVLGSAPPGVTITCLRRTSAFNEWSEMAPSAVTPADVVRPFPGASVIAVVRLGLGSSPPGEVE
jgi:hypothetical protein